jgi:hypothetical protein
MDRVADMGAPQLPGPKAGSETIAVDAWPRVVYLRPFGFDAFWSVFIPVGTAAPDDLWRLARFLVTWNLEGV